MGTSFFILQAKRTGGKDVAKKYWLKLNAHFFKDSHLIYLKTQKNGYEYIYLWQCLLLKCLEVEDDKEIGFLRLNEKIPYTPELLSEVFSVNIDIVKSAIDIFFNMGMLEILDNGTIYIEAVQKMLGRESESAERVRIHRERKKLLSLQCNNVVTKCNPIENKNKNKSKSRVTKSHIPNNVEEVKSYILEKNLKHTDADKFYKWYSDRDWTDNNGNPVKNWKNKLLYWEETNIEKEKNPNKSIYENLDNYIKDASNG